MPTPTERSQSVLNIIVAAADAIKLLSGMNGAAATELATMAAAEVRHVISQRRARALRGRKQRRAKR